MELENSENKTSSGMSVIKIYQSYLDGKRFWSESLVDSIRCEAEPESNSGSLWTIEDGKLYNYKLIQDSASLIIESGYFGEKKYIVTTPLGFNLHRVEGWEIHLKFIDEFWVDHQELINAILSFITQDINKDRQFTNEELARETAKHFDKTLD